MKKNGIIANTIYDLSANKIDSVKIYKLNRVSIETYHKSSKSYKLSQPETKKLIEQLKDIRKAQNAYKDVNNKYTGSFDTLISFIKSDSMPMIKSI